MNQVRSIEVEFSAKAMNNNRQCPICRSPLTSSNCKKCGYQQKKLKIVETQEEFGKFNFINKIQHSQQARSSKRRLTAEERLKLYLRQYIKLLKTAANKLASTRALSSYQAQQLNQTVFQIWKQYLLRRRELGLSLTGIFKRHIASKQKAPSSIPTTRGRKKRSEAKKQEADAASQKEEDSSVQEKQEIEKRRAADAERAGEGVTPREQLQIKHKFRSYYIVSVKPLIQQSIQERSIDPHALTSCQKAFLSYLLATSGIDEDFARMCSHKYLKMLLQLSGRGGEKSYVKDTEMQKQLSLRNCGRMEKKQDCIMVILLIDLLWCFDAQSFHLPSHQQLTDLLALYQKCDNSSEIIDVMVNSFSKPDPPSNPNIPDITFELIYTIIYLASAKIGACLTISEILAACGSLQIGRITVEQDLYLQGIRNEQAITASKIRKSAHLLSSFLELKGEVLLNKWCQKWCSKLQLKQEAPKICVISQLIFTQMVQEGQKDSAKGEFMSEGRVIKYKRHFWVEQDVSCLAVIVLYLKLATGITNYPFIVNFPLKELREEKEITNQEMATLSQLMQNKSILINNTTTNLLKNMVLPETYHHQVSLLALSRSLANLPIRDPAYQSYSLNKDSIRFRNMSHMNGVGINDLIAKFTHLKDARFGPQQSQTYEIQLKYEEAMHKQFAREVAEKYKKIRTKKGKTASRPTAVLNVNILHQMSCILRQRDEVVTVGEAAVHEECVVDEPSCNYQLMWEYNLENLTLSNRKEQLYLMEMLCLNLCTFSELAYWLNRQQALLKFFEA